MSTPPIESPDPVDGVLMPEVAPTQPEPRRVPAPRETSASSLNKLIELAENVLDDDDRTRRAHSFLDPVFKVASVLLIAFVVLAVLGAVLLVAGLVLHSATMMWIGTGGLGLGAVSTSGALAWRLLRRAHIGAPRSTPPGA